MILGYGSEEHRDAFSIRSEVSSRIHWCRTPHEIGQILRGPPVDVLLWELSRESTFQTSEIVDLVRRFRPDLQIVLSIELSRSTAREVLHVAQALPFVRVCIQGTDNRTRKLLEACAAAEERQRRRAPEGVILGQAGACIPVRALDIVVAAAVLTQRCTSVRVLAQVCGQAIRTIEWRLSRDRLPAARDIIGSLTALHVLWRLEVLSNPTKLAAASMGFRDPEALMSFVKHHTGARPAVLMRHGGFPEALDAWLTTLANCCRI